MVDVFTRVLMKTRRWSKPLPLGSSCLFLTRTSPSDLPLFGLAIDEEEKGTYAWIRKQR